MRTCSRVRVNLRGHQAFAVPVVSEAADVPPADGAGRHPQILLLLSAVAVGARFVQTLRRRARVSVMAHLVVLLLGSVQKASHVLN